MISHLFSQHTLSYTLKIDSSGPVLATGDTKGSNMGVPWALEIAKALGGQGQCLERRQ